MLLGALLLAPGAGAITRVEAERAALRALKVRQGTKPVIVFRLRTPLARGTTIGEAGTARPAKARPRRARYRRQRIRNAAGVAVVRLPVVARVRGERAWFFYEDQGPYQAYQHPGRVVLVGERTGRVRVSRTLRWAPLVNGRLPVFLALNPAYLDSRYRAFAREWSVPRGLRTPPLARAAAADPGALSKARELLAREASCFVRISDTVGTMYDFGPVESAEVGLSGFFVRLGLRNSPATYRYSIFSGTTPTGYIQRRLIRRDRCRDIFVYVAGGGFRTGTDAVNIGNRSLPGGVSEQQNLTAADLRRLISRNPGVTFKLKVDAPYSADLLSGLQGLRNLLIFEAAAPGNQASFEYLPPLGGDEGSGVRRRLAFTSRQLIGLERFLADPREVDHAAAAVALGRAPSFMAWMLARGFALGADDDMAERLGVPPQIQTFGFTPDGPNPPPNRAPSAQDQSVSVTEDEPKDVTLTGSDPDGDVLSFDVTSGPAHGALSGSGATRTYTPDAEYSGPDSFTFSVSDGRGGTATGTVTIDVKSENDPPVVTTSPGATAYTEQDDPGAVIDGALTVADVDDTQLEGATVRVSGGFQFGDRLDFVDQLGIAGSYDSGTGVLTLTGDASLGDYQAALRSVRYRFTGNNPAADKLVEFRADDGDSNGPAATKALSVTGVNDPPEVDTTNSALAYSEGEGPEFVDDNVDVSDPDSPLQGATVTIAQNFVSAEDELSFVNQSGITGSYDDTTGTLTLTGTATVADYQSALRSVTYENSSDNPSSATRTVSFKVTDTSAAESNVDERQINLSATNDPPVLTNSAGATSYTEGDPGTVVDGALTLTDADDANLEGAEVRIAAGFQSGDQLVFVDQNGISGTYNSGTGVLALTGTASVADYQTALRSVAYSHAGDNPQGGKSVQFTATDGDAGSEPDNKTIDITGVNDAPTVTTTGSTLGYSEGDGATAVDPGLTLSDPENDQMSGATVQITGNFTGAEDQLTFVDQLGITGSYDSGTGTLTLSGTTSAANYQTALRAVRYLNSSDTPSPATRTVSFQTTDAGTPNLASNVATRDVTVAAVNDAPVVDTTDTALPYAEGDPATTADSGLTVADVDDANLESAQVRVSTGFQSGDELIFVDQLGITGSYDSGTGVLTLTGSATKADYQTALRSVQYRHTGPGPSATKTLGFRVNDGDVDSAEAFRDVNVTGSNDGPIVTSGGTLAYTEDDPATAVDSALTVDDAEDDQISGASASITANFQAGEDTLAWSDNDATDNIGLDVGNSTNQTIVLTGNDTEAKYQAALRAVTYANGSQSPSTTNRTVTFSATDALGAVGTDTRTISVASVDDPPVAVNDDATVAEDDSATAITVLANDTDADAGPMTIASATDPANGTVALTGGSPGAHSGLTYQPDPNYCNDPPGTTTDTFNYTLNGGSTATVSVTVTCVNDDPQADDETFDADKSAHGNTTFIVDDGSDGAPTVTHPSKTVSGDILAGDTDVDGPGPLVITNAGTFATANGGSVTLEEDGDFTFHPEASASCTDATDSFDYTISDSASGTPGTDTGTVTIALEGCVWYVRNDASAGGAGTANAPFDTLAEAETASGSNHTVFVFDGDNTSSGLHTGFALNSGERLIGEHEGLSVDPDGGGSLGADTLHPANPGAHPTLTATNEDVVELDDGNEVRGFNIDPEGTGGGIAGASGDTGGGKIDDVNVVDTGTAGTQPGVELDTTTGTFDFSNLTVSTTGGATAVRLNNAGTANFAGTGTIALTSTGGKALDATSTNMGTGSVFDEITATGSGAGGVGMVNTTGTTTFGDGSGTDLNLTTTSGTSPAFQLVNAGSVSVPGGGDANVRATGGPAIDIQATSGGTYEFDDVDSTDSAGDGINLDGLGSGTFSAASGDIAGYAGTGFDLNGGSGAIAYPGNFADAGGPTVADISGRTGGTVSLPGTIADGPDTGGGITLSGNSGGSTTFSAASKVLNTGTGNGLVMSTSDGHTLVLSGGGLDIDATTGKGLEATTSGTLEVTGAGNTINTTSGRALNVENTDIGANDLTFQHVSSSGAVNGIRLENTGSTGGLAVTGTGTANTGGTIANSTGAGISLSGVGGGVALSSMNVTGGADDGIRGTNVTGFTLNGASPTVSSNGNAVTEHGFDFSGLTGTVALTGVTASANAEDNFHLVNDGGSLSMTVSNGSFSNTANNASTGNDGIYLEGTGSGTMTAVIQDVTLNDNRGDHVQLNTDNSNTVTQNLTVDNGNLDADPATSNGGGIAVSPGGGATVSATLTDNDVQGADGSALVVDTTSGSAGAPTTAVVNTTISGNVIGAVANARSGSFSGNGIQVIANGSSTVNALVANNQIRQYTNVAGIRLSQGDGTTAQLRATVRSNTLSDPSAALGGTNGVYVTAGLTSTPAAGGAADAGTMCLDLGGAGVENALGGSGTGGAGFEDVFVWQRQSSKIQLPGLGGTTTDAAAASYLQARNTGSPTVYTESTPANTGFQNTTSCPLPS